MAKTMPPQTQQAPIPARNDGQFIASPPAAIVRSVLIRLCLGAVYVLVLLEVGVVLGTVT